MKWARCERSEIEVIFNDMTTPGNIPSPPPPPPPRPSIHSKSPTSPRCVCTLSIFDRFIQNSSKHYVLIGFMAMKKMCVCFNIAQTHTWRGEPANSRLTAVTTWYAHSLRPVDSKLNTPLSPSPAPALLVPFRTQLWHNETLSEQLRKY